MANDTYLQFDSDKTFPFKIMNLIINEMNYFKKNSNSISKIWILVERLKMILNSWNLGNTILSFT